MAKEIGWTDDCTALYRAELWEAMIGYLREHNGTATITLQGPRLVCLTPAPARIEKLEHRAGVLREAIGRVIDHTGHAIITPYEVQFRRLVDDIMLVLNQYDLDDGSLEVRLGMRPPATDPRQG